MDEDAPYDIRVCQESEEPELDEDRLRDSVIRTLQWAGRSRAHISIALVRDERIARLNEQYLDHEGPTDVLTFDLSDGGDSDVDGELVISSETAVREAASRGHDPVAEILLYAIHGTLHLCGMNDDTEGNARAMHEAEDGVLREMGFGPIFAGSTDE